MEQARIELSIFIYITGIVFQFNGAADISETIRSFVISQWSILDLLVELNPENFWATGLSCRHISTGLYSKQKLDNNGFGWLESNLDGHLSRYSSWTRLKSPPIRTLFLECLTFKWSKCKPNSPSNVLFWVKLLYPYIFTSIKIELSMLYDKY